MSGRSLVLAGLCSLAVVIQPARAGDIEFPQIIRIRYEATDLRLGGTFILWAERERVQYGLDPRLYPSARYVEVTQITPTVGSITLTFVEVQTVSAQVPDYLHLTGNLRFRVTGMKIQSSNFPKGQGMAPTQPSPTQP